jgi:hypothetical protein
MQPRIGSKPWSWPTSRPNSLHPLTRSGPNRRIRSAEIVFEVYRLQEEPVPITEPALGCADVLHLESPRSACALKPAPQSPTEASASTHKASTPSSKAQLQGPAPRPSSKARVSPTASEESLHKKASFVRLESFARNWTRRIPTRLIPRPPWLDFVLRHLPDSPQICLVGMSVDCRCLGQEWESKMMDKKN